MSTESDRALRDLLPEPEVPNPLEWCERCRKMHRRYPLTRADYDAVIRESARDVADKIDAEAVEAILRWLDGPRCTCQIDAHDFHCPIHNAEGSR